MDVEALAEMLLADPDVIDAFAAQKRIAQEDQGAHRKFQDWLRENGGVCERQTFEEVD